MMYWIVESRALLLNFVSSWKWWWIVRRIQPLSSVRESASELIGRRRSFLIVVNFRIYISSNIIPLCFKPILFSIRQMVIWYWKFRRLFLRLGNILYAIFYLSENFKTNIIKFYIIRMTIIKALLAVLTSLYFSTLYFICIYYEASEEESAYISRIMHTLQKRIHFLDFLQHPINMFLKCLLREIADEFYSFS